MIVNVHKTTIQWGRGLNRVLSWDYFMRSLSIDWILLFDRLLRSFFSKLLHLNGGCVIQLPFGFHHPWDNVAVVQETVRSIWIQEFLYYSFLWSGSLYSVLFTALSARRGMWPLKKSAPVICKDCLLSWIIWSNLE